MKIKNFRFRLLLTAGLVAVVVVVMVILGIIAPKPPLVEVAKARESISYSRVFKAQHYMSANYSIALEMYDTLMAEWKRQNQLFFLKRNFSRVEELAAMVIVLSEDLKTGSEENIMYLEALLSTGLSELKNRIDMYDMLFNRIPMSKSLTEQYTKGKLHYLESKSAFENKNYNLAYNNLQLALKLCNEVIEIANLQLKNYFDNYNTWIKLVEDAVARSRKKKEYVIIVDKFAKTCKIYYTGKLRSTFEVELGPNWIGDKRHQGDNATPEGKYMVTKKLAGRDTKYYKALLLNYPNEEDRKRFNEEIKNGTLPKSSDIGGLIEIHGEGGKGFNWTNGCIALNNNNMDVVFKSSSVGTPVIVIGSLKNLSELFNLN